IPPTLRWPFRRPRTVLSRTTGTPHGTHADLSVDDERHRGRDVDHARVAVGMVVEPQDHALGLRRRRPDVRAVNALPRRLLQHDHTPLQAARSAGWPRLHARGESTLQERVHSRSLEHDRCTMGRHGDGTVHRHHDVAPERDRGSRRQEGQHDVQRQPSLLLRRRLPAARERLREHSGQGPLRVFGTSCRRVRRAGIDRHELREPRLQPGPDGVDPHRRTSRTSSV
ncbi:hypothetical protein LTR04_003222, partial [Oleoguttula sp. CCFEE 6159]